MVPPIELRPRVPGTFDLFVTGIWIGAIQYLWNSWHYSYLGRSLDLKSFLTSQEAVAALLAYHAKRSGVGGALKAQIPPKEINPPEEYYVPP